MPRRNHRPSHTPFVFANQEAGKKRYDTKHLAEQAAEEHMLLHPELELFVYKSPTDGGWYLTRRTPNRND